MRAFRYHLPTAVVAAMSLVALWHGPIIQPADYHDFADRTLRLGIPHFTDVASNLGFALIALWGWCGLAGSALWAEQAGYRLFLVGLFLTAFGSAWYHLAPDNARLVWDRLPIALACAGLLAGVWGDVWTRSSKILTLMLSTLALSSVVWWHYTEQAGAGDLRPYLLLQGLPLILIPLW